MVLRHSCHLVSQWALSLLYDQAGLELLDPLTFSCGEFCILEEELDCRYIVGTRELEMMLHYEQSILAQ